MGGLVIMNIKCAHKDDNIKEPLHYKTCGLDDVYLLSGYEVKQTPYGESISIKNLDDLNKAIGYHLVSEEKKLSGKELRFLRKQMDLTQAELGVYLGLSDQQVARWEKAKNEIKKSTDHLMRILYLDHLDGNVKVIETLKDLDEKATSVHEKYYFANTASGWVNQPLDEVA